MAGRQIEAHVIYDANDGLRVVDKDGKDQSQITLTGPDDTVSWFPPIDSLFPVGANLLIAFEEPLGPFKVIRSVNPQSLLAKGNTGVVASFPYSLFLILGSQGNQPEPGSPPERLARGGPFSVKNECTTPNSIPKVTIQVDLSSDPPVLTPPPDPIRLFQGDVVQLEMPGLPDGFVATFRFLDGNDDLGLFPAYFVTRQSEAVPRLFTATFGSHQKEPSKYLITVWDSKGSFVAFKDPTVDGLGRPPGSGN